jgi:oligopeptide transport system ATP-binding protein
VSTLAVEGLRVRLPTPAGDVTVVDGVDYDVQPAEVFGIAGESGSGKTVSMLALLGLLPDGSRVEGTARFGGHELIGMPRRRLQSISGRDIAMVFQDPYTSLHPMLSIGKQLTEHVRRHLGLDRRSADDRAVELLHEVRIPNPRAALRRFPHQFSGGMRQRIAIAIALACRPRLLIADEPTTALDVTVQAGILDLLDELREQHEMSMIIITHDMGVVAEAADEIAVMYAGQIVEHTSAEELFDHPEHPYTEALLGSLPQLEGENVRHDRLTAIPGRPPDLVDLPDACRFAPRCPYANPNDACARHNPELREIRPRHLVRSAHPASERAGELTGARA